jgi:hypothetical protein
VEHYQVEQREPEVMSGKKWADFVEADSVEIDTDEI